MKYTGVSCFIGLAVTSLFLPINHYAGKVVISAQENLMKARDERMALMNEILGGIRMVKVKFSFVQKSIFITVLDLSSWPGNAASRNASSPSERKSSNINE